MEIICVFFYLLMIMISSLIRPRLVVVWFGEGRDWIAPDGMLEKAGLMERCFSQLLWHIKNQTQMSQIIDFPCGIKKRSW